MADIGFVGSGVTDAAEPPLPVGGATPRRQAVVWGRRVKTVDVHALGTDDPYPWTSTAVDRIPGPPSLIGAERAAVLGDTARAWSRTPS